MNLDVRDFDSLLGELGFRKGFWSSSRFLVGVNGVIELFPTSWKDGSSINRVEITIDGQMPVRTHCTRTSASVQELVNQYKDKLGEELCLMH